MELPLDLIMFAALIASILLGYHVAFTISGLATIFAIIGVMTGQFDFSLMSALGQRIFGTIVNTSLTAIPLFIFMGLILEKSRIAEEMLETMGQLFGKVRGGLGISVVLVGALLAASTGIVGATVTAMGLIALPTMLRNGYNPALAAGTVATAGTLGQIIPPSTLLIILADVMSNAFQQAQYEKGAFSVETISIGQLFAAAMIPGLLLVLLYCIYIFARAYLTKNDAPALKIKVKISTPQIFSAIVPPVLLIIAVLGTISIGIASPTEAAAVGAIGALLLSGRKVGVSKRTIFLGTASFLLLIILVSAHPVRIQRSDNQALDYALAVLYFLLALGGSVVLLICFRQNLHKGIMQSALRGTMSVSSMIFATLTMASFFSLVFVGLGGEDHVREILTNMPGGVFGAILFSSVFIFILGCFMDFVEISVILLPALVPPLLMMDVDPIWLSIVFAINLQTSFLTPPFGFSLFYLRAAAPKEITTGHIYSGVFPYILIHILGIVLVCALPALSTWLPNRLF